MRSRLTSESWAGKAGWWTCSSKRRSITYPNSTGALLRDYVEDGVDEKEVLAELHGFDSDQLSDVVEMAQVLGYDSASQTDDFFIRPRGYRQLEQIPRLPRKVADSLVQEFGSLKELLGASQDELDDVDGVGQARARAIRRGLERQKNLEPSGEVL